MSKFSLFIAALCIFAISCSKGGDSAPTPPAPKPPAQETQVAFSITQDPGTGNILGVVGTAQPINIRVSSAIPTAGVNIEVTVRKDADNSVVFTNTASTIATDNTINITGLTPGVLCTVTVTVTSKSTASNTKLATFKLAAK
jgi:hypothetical protein